MKTLVCRCTKIRNRAGTAGVLFWSLFLFLFNFENWRSSNDDSGGGGGGAKNKTSTHEVIQGLIKWQKERARVVAWAKEIKARTPRSIYVRRGEFGQKWECVNRNPSTSTYTKKPVQKNNNCNENTRDFRFEAQACKIYTIRANVEYRSRGK